VWGCYSRHGIVCLSGIARELSGIVRERNSGSLRKQLAAYWISIFVFLLVKLSGHRHPLVK
jgi:hypothetical protein